MSSSFSIFNCLAVRELQRPVAVQNAQHITMRHTVQRSIVEHLLDLALFIRCGVLIGVYDRECRFPLAKIARHRLTQNFFGSRKVQHVVHDLEGHSDVAAITSEPCNFFFGSSAENPTQLHAG